MGRLFTCTRAALGIGVVTIALSGCYHSNVPWSGGDLADPVVAEKFRLGPFNLAPMSQPGWEFLGNHQVPRPTGNVALKEMDFNVVDGDGNTVGFDRVHLHHIVMITHPVDTYVVRGS